VAVAPRGAANEAAVPTGGAAAVAPRGPASQAPVPAGANLSDADLADALKAIGEAIMNEKSPNFEKARLLYRESLALALSPRAFIGWGFAAQALGLLDEADVAFRGALAVARNERAAQGAREHILNVADAAKKNGVTLHSLPVPSPTLSLPGSLEDRSYALNEVGKEALVNHRYDTARALFQRAYALFPSVKPLANLATAQVQLGHCDDARAIARQVIATWPEDLAELRAQRVRAQKLIDVCNAR
jgi:tetratricopeptide (TPR) repeat protein